MEVKKRKYLLLSSSNDEKKPCAFFISDAGCRNGAACPFLHGSQAPAVVNSAPAPKPVIYKQEKVEEKIVRKVPKKVEAVPEVIKVKKVKQISDPTPVEVSIPIRVPEVEKKTHSKRAPVDSDDDYAAPVNKVHQIDNSSVMKALEAQKRQFELQLKLQEDLFLQQQQQMQQQMMMQKTDSEKARQQQEQYLAEDDKKKAKQTSRTPVVAPLVSVKFDRQTRLDQKKKRKSNEAKAAAVQQQQALPQTPVRSDAVDPNAQQSNRFSLALGLPVSTPRDSICVSSAHNSNRHDNSSSKSNSNTITNMNNMHTSKSVAASEEEEDTQFLFGAVNTALKGGDSSAPNTPNTSNSIGKGNSSNNNSNSNNNSTSESNPFLDQESFRGLGVKEQPTTQALACLNRTQSAVPSGMLASGLPIMRTDHKTPQEISDMLSTCITGHRSLPWNPLALKTQENPRFLKDYTFEGDHTWVTAKPFTEWINADPRRKNYPSVIAIDCEMCETTDPVTGVKDHCNLIRVSVVNGLDPSEVLLDSLVSPTLPITEWRSNIHGIGEDDLQGVVFTLRHAQAFILNLCSDRTIIVGHALHHDLKALHLHHKTCIDSAYFYGVANEPGHHASVRDISVQILGIKLPDLHDSVQDARTALQASAYICKHGSAPLIVRSVNYTEPSLLLHRIPMNCTEEQLEQMILQNTQIVPLLISPVVRGRSDAAGDSTMGRTTIFFSTQLHADLAFESIPGPNRPDKMHRSQKRVYLKQGGYIWIRRNCYTEPQHV